MIRWILILVCIGTLTVFASTLFEGYVLKWQLANEFNHNSETNALINSESFMKSPLEQKIYDLSINEVKYNIARESLQIQQSIFFLLLSIGAVILSSGLAWFFFVVSHQFNKHTRDIAESAELFGLLGL
ncbi:MAG: hypothetical protein JXB43_00670 [Dehalococcoidia bacterium]|nr:hypothetical protein [Dehalococcoidia bacterium]